MEKPCLLTETHELKRFRCRKHQLNFYLKKLALLNAHADSSKTYVVLEENSVIAYYSICYGSATHAESPVEVKDGIHESHSIPVMLLARLAVNEKNERQGIGRALLQEVVKQAYSASQIAALRSLVVDAIDDEAANWYKDFGFIDSPIKQMRLFLPIAAIRDAIENN